MSFYRKITMLIMCISLAASLWGWGKKESASDAKGVPQPVPNQETVLPADKTIDTDSAQPGTPRPKNSAGLSAEELQPGTDWVTVTAGSKVLIHGRIRLIGNEPFSQLILTDDAGKDWYVSDDDRPRLRNLEQRRVSLTAEVEIKPMILANGKHMEDRRILKNIELVQ